MDRVIESLRIELIIQLIISLVVPTGSYLILECLTLAVPKAIVVEAIVRRHSYKASPGGPQ